MGDANHLFEPALRVRVCRCRTEQVVPTLVWADQEPTGFNCASQLLAGKHIAGCMFVREKGKGVPPPIANRRGLPVIMCMYVGKVARTIRTRLGAEEAC